MSSWIDISVPLYSGMVHWPGDPEVEITQKRLDVQGTVVHLTSMNMGAHTGTHMDAPLHFVDGGQPMDSWEVEATNGPVHVIDIKDPKAVRAAELQQHRIDHHSRIIFRTVNTHANWPAQPFNEDFVYIARDAARYLVEKQVRMVGVDYLSIGGFHNDLVATHVTLLSAGVWVVEGLDLSAISAGTYELACMPLRLKGADGAPARAFVRPIQAAV